STASIEYIHPNFTTILGHDHTKIDFRTIIEHLHPSDLPYFYHFEESAVRFFSNLPPDLFFKYKFSFDYRIRTANGDYKRFLIQVIPINYFPQGGARTLSKYTDITHLNVQGTPKLSFIGMKGAPTYHNVHLKEGFEIHIHPFTAKEHEILQLIVQGLRTEDIANKLHRSVFTIRNHRKNILRKSECSSVSELIAKAIREGWV
ncbi:MAG TPA: LuxR C-terminal-related transcriptional regulator, partial [Bacteroidia bacterium]